MGRVDRKAVPVMSQGTWEKLESRLLLNFRVLNMTLGTAGRTPETVETCIVQTVERCSKALGIKKELAGQGSRGLAVSRRYHLDITVKDSVLILGTAISGS